METRMSRSNLGLDIRAEDAAVIRSARRLLAQRFVPFGYFFRENIRFRTFVYEIQFLYVVYGKWHGVKYIEKYFSMRTSKKTISLNLSIRLH